MMQGVEKYCMGIIALPENFLENQHTYLRNHRTSKLEETLDYTNGNPL